MTHVCQISLQTLEAQADMFRLAEFEYGLTLAKIHRKTSIPYETLRSWAGNKGSPTMMPVSAINRLKKVIPDHLLSLLLSPSDAYIASAGDCDHDAYAAHCDEYGTAYREAVHPESPKGRNIAECEDRKLSTLRAVNEGGRK